MRLHRRRFALAIMLGLCLAGAPGAWAAPPARPAPADDRGIAQTAGMLIDLLIAPLPSPARGTTVRAHPRPSIAAHPPAPIAAHPRASIVAHPPARVGGPPPVIARAVRVSRSAQSRHR